MPETLKALGLVLGASAGLREVTVRFPVGEEIAGPAAYAALAPLNTTRPDLGLDPCCVPSHGTKSGPPHQGCDV